MSDTVYGSLGAGSATRDVSNLRNKPSVTELIKTGRSQLTDLSGNHKIELDWELNEMAVRDKIFKMKVDDTIIYIDLEELLFITRVMFMKR